MNKIKLLTFSVIGLLILNLGIICYLFFSKPSFENRGRNDGGRNPKEVIGKRLHFDENQIKQYEAIIMIHRKKIDSLDANIKGIKLELYSKLQGNSVNTKANDSLINLMLTNQKLVEETHLKHFQDIKKICRKEQLNNFNELTKDLGKLFSNNKKEPRRDNNIPPRDENYPRPQRGEHRPRPDRDGDFPPPPPRDLNQHDPIRDENRPPPPPWDENHPRRPGDENRPPPPPRNDDE
ncbi:MAG: hypothetical protein RL308_1528 [Bacteroidota bacterium]|jgi:hypothetical protein